jgi:hypothetical protein
MLAMLGCEGEMLNMRAVWGRDVDRIHTIALAQRLGVGEHFATEVGLETIQVLTMEISCGCHSDVWMFRQSR